MELNIIVTVEVAEAIIHAASLFDPVDWLTTHRFVHLFVCLVTYLIYLDTFQIMKPMGTQDIDLPKAKE